MLPKVLALVAVSILHLPWSSTQGCLSKQQVANTIRQMQKLLSSHEAAQMQNMRNLKKQLTILQGNIQKQVAKHNDSCTLLPVPPNGRRLGRKTLVGHDVHFLCDPGFLLVGSETRTCLDNGTWSGHQPFCKSINYCASNPCANGGTCVDGTHRYSCLCPSGWSGATCQAPVYSHWVTLSNSSFSRQPRCADNLMGSRQCRCDAGFQMQAGSICQDVDECQLFQSSRPTRICLHECVNVPGSYRCTCPDGYRLQADKSTCSDVDECAENQHNCSRGQTCINVFGGFRCVRPECPKAQLNTSYVKTSAAQCERSPCPMDSKACQRAANSISFHYLPLQSNRTVPRVLFKMSTSRFVGDSLRFAILGGNGQGMLVVQRADRQAGELVLTRPAVGPTTLEAELEMSEFARKMPLGKHIFKITIFVAQYEF
ncbi:fibulin-7-like [Sphaerodactylus townsendi]|uniref:fibulin-7-like n=1 Tax=Sphaerodactylus townsendi TaxID=933632 RepID=UPI00202674FC|nr:fibulin-7-like [Sphaerodactylus townsendi]